MQSAQYSLRQMVDVTGITEFTLRGWELRYGAFEPARTDTGRRRYSARDLQKALLLRELVKREHRIGDIASLRLSQLKEMMGSDSEDVAATAQKYRTEIRSVMKSVALQDWALLETELANTIKRLKPLNALREFILPIFEQMAQSVASGRMSIAQEHILSSMLKQSLHRLIEPHPAPRDIRIVIASPEGDFHELGILAAHALANQHAACSLYIGPNTPKSELCETANRFGATHVLLGTTISKKEGAKDDFYSFVHFLDQNLPQSIAFWMGGRASQPVTLKRETLQLKSLADLERELTAPKRK